jgi:NAD(P)-dependent dehydrogenase (short-subunit alcohol dehydrogenase family)
MRRRAIVTGAAGGLGAATAKRLGARGCLVALSDLDEARLRDVSTLCGDLAVPIVADLAHADGPEMVVREAQRQLGGVDILVTCAAAAPAEAFLEMTAAAWEAALLVNVRAVALAMAAAGRVMAAQGSGGRIVNVTSAAARMALPNYAAYAASKAALDSLTRSAAVALAKHGIRVNSLSPGMMDTPLQVRTEELFCRLDGRDDLERYKAERTARIPAGRRTDPEEMSQMAVWLALDAPDYITAERLNASGGLDKD